jgi:hypothetical protein
MLHQPRVCRGHFGKELFLQKNLVVHVGKNTIFAARKNEEMKKLNIILGVVLFAAMIMVSCDDKSGDYVEQLYTNAQKSTAIKGCLKISADSALNHLCENNGFYDYLDGQYRIDYTPLKSSLFDTLDNHGYGYLADTLIWNTNRLAANCKAQIASSIATAIDSLVIVDYDALINGEETAITDYFELYKYRYLKSAFQSPVSVRMTLYNVTPIWNEMVQKYAQYTSAPLNFDIQNYIVEKMLEDILNEMRVEEELIRTDTTHGSSATGLFRK